MITCKNVRENLMDALAEEQTSPEVLAHLRECGTCSAELDGLRKTMTLLDEWEAPEPSPYFLTRVKARRAAKGASARGSSILVSQARARRHIRGCAGCRRRGVAPECV
jgi:hypothetical protein